MIVCLFVRSVCLFSVCLFACLFICFQRLLSVTVVSSGVRAIGYVMFNIIDNHWKSVWTLTRNSDVAVITRQQRLIVYYFICIGNNPLI